MHCRYGEIGSANWPFEKWDKGLYDVGNKSWHPIWSNKSSVSIQVVCHTQITETQPQTKYVYKSSLGYLSKCENNYVSGGSNFCNHEVQNNVQSGFVHNAIVEVYIAMSVSMFPPKPACDQKTDSGQVGKVHHTPSVLPEPSLLFEVSDRFLVWFIMMLGRSQPASLIMCLLMCVLWREHRQCPGAHRALTLQIVKLYKFPVFKRKSKSNKSSNRAKHKQQ